MSKIWLITRKNSNSQIAVRVSDTSGLGWFTSEISKTIEKMETEANTYRGSGLFKKMKNLSILECSRWKDALRDSRFSDFDFKKIEVRDMSPSDITDYIQRKNSILFRTWFLEQP